jgi:integrase
MPRTQKDGVFTRKDRKGFFISWKDANGKRRKRKTNSRTLLQARNALEGERRRVEEAKYLGFIPPGEDTFSEVAGRFLAFQKARVSKKEHVREEGILRNHLKPFFPGTVASIRKVDIDKYITQRSGEVSPATVRREAMILKYLLSKSVDWEIVPVNPAVRSELPPVPQGRVRYLQPTELRTLLDVSPEWLRPIIGLAVFTGMRRGEVLSLRYLDIDMNHGCILLPQTKNGEGRIIYLNSNAMSVLASLPPGSPMEKLFPKITADNVSVAFHRACRKAGIEDFRFHDLRHTTGSWLAMSGKDIYTIAKILGHKDLRMSVRYSHLSAQYLSDAVRGLDKVFGDKMAVSEVPSPQSVPAPVALLEEETVSA